MAGQCHRAMKGQSWHHKGPTSHAHQTLAQMFQGAVVTQKWNPAVHEGLGMQIHHMYSVHYCAAINTENKSVRQIHRVHTGKALRWLSKLKKQLPEMGNYCPMGRVSVWGDGKALEMDMLTAAQHMNVLDTTECTLINDHNGKFCYIYFTSVLKILKEKRKKQLQNSVTRTPFF